MAHKKRGKKCFRWNKSELPDNDANTQVLLLGVTRLDTPPRSSPPIFVKPNRPHTYHATTTTTIDANLYKTTAAVDNIDDTQKTAANRKFNSSNYLADRRGADQLSNTNWIRPKASTTTFLSTKSKRSLSSFLGRFNRHSSDKDHSDNADTDGATVRLINCPLVIETQCQINVDQINHPTSANIDDNNPKTELAITAFRVKKSKTARLTSCIPYCANKHESSEAPTDSLASSLRIAECCSPLTTNLNHHRLEPHQRQNILISQLNRLRNSNELIPSYSSRISNKSTQQHRHNNNNNSNLFNNLNIMDRSVDSIGSCSLDVDAESTDFSDTSGSLNVCTPLSGKDFTREFTSRIHERCQLPVHAQQTKTVLDPNSGKISTIISPPVSIEDVSLPQAIPAKKPSYLNLACCVNGYSNLTTYDSKFRQSINRSREVSPIRPITHTVQYNRGNTNYLVVPVSVPINDHNNKTNSMMDAHTILSPEKRFFSQQMQQKTIEMNSTGRDITDNINSNGCTTYFKKTMLTTTTTNTTTSSSSSSISKDSGNDAAKNAKSFIQQRVERLYGTGALAQGLYSPKKPKQIDENGGGNVSLSSILVEKSQNSSKFNGYAASTFTTTTNGSTSDVENVNLDASNETPLPVMRHLRPEFRAQLPMLSPKRTTPVKATNGDATTSSNGKVECQNGIDVSPSNGAGVGNNNVCSSGGSSGGNSSNNVATPMTNGCINTNIKQRLTNADENSLTSTKCDTEHNKFCHTVKNDSSGDVSHNTSLTEIMNSMNNMRLNETDDRSCIETSNGQTTMTEMSSKAMRKTIDAPASPSVANKIVESDANGNHKTESQRKDALYFLATAHSERDRLIGMALETEKELDALLQREDMDEDMLGHLRSAGGKARLLATQKFKQFEGLCNNCLNQVSGDSFPPPTPDDLQGFWDMVMLQVNHVDSLYTELDSFRANNWKNPVQEKPKAAPLGSKLPKRPTVSAAATAASTAKKSAAAIVATQKREAQRKLLMEMKRKNKLAINAVASDTICAPVDSSAVSHGNNGQSNETDR